MANLLQAWLLKANDKNKVEKLNRSRPVSTEPGLPSPANATTAAANAAVRPVLDKEKARGPYAVISPQKRAAIARFAVFHGTVI